MLKVAFVTFLSIVQCRTINSRTLVDSQSYVPQRPVHNQQHEITQEHLDQLEVERLQNEHAQ